MDSDEYTSEDSRKRSRKDEEEGIFTATKKTMRTPVKSRNKEEGKMDQILAALNNLATQTQNQTIELKEIKEEQREYRKEVRELKKKIDEINQHNMVLKDENAETKAELKKIKDRVEMLEKEKRENNIIIKGLLIDTNNGDVVKETITNFIKQELDLEVTIEEAYKLGTATCLAKMERKEDKINVLKNKNKLRQVAGRQIYIDNDLTKEEMRIQKEIRQIAREEKNKGRAVKVGYQKIIIEGKVWKWNKETDSLKNENPKN